MYSSFFRAYDSTGWDDVSFSPAKKHQLCLDMVVVVTDVSQRLVDQMAQPSREILRAAADILEGGDLRSLVSEAERVSGVRTTCNKCVDPYFTGVYVDRLLTRSTRVRAHEGLRDISATSNVTNTLVEKTSHITGG